MKAFQHPILIVLILLFWMFLTSFSPGQFLMGTGIALFAAWSYSALDPPRVHIRSWSAVFRLTGSVFVDIITSNIAVARLLLGKNPERRSGFVAIPLELRDRTGLALLALIINNAPGTAWLEYDSKTGIVLTHVFDYHADDEDWPRTVKERYEKPLREIFE